MSSCDFSESQWRDLGENAFADMRFLQKQIVWGRYKAVRITVKNGKVRITAPNRANRSEVFAFLQSKCDWIRRAIAKTKIQANEKCARAKPFAGDFRNGGVIYLKGRPVALVFNAAAEETRADPQDPDRLIVAGETDELRRQSFLRFLNERFAIECRTQSSKWTEKMKVGPETIKPSLAKTRWGSCNRRGTIHLNLRLLLLPQECLDYVMVHEMAHLVHFNHSPAFWSLVEKFYPDHREVRAMLRKVDIKALLQII